MAVATGKRRCGLCRCSSTSCVKQGYTIVPVAQLLGKSRADIMPSVTGQERWWTGFDHLGFSLYALLYAGIVLIFVAGDGLIIVRLLSLASLATFNRFRRPRSKPPRSLVPPSRCLSPRTMRKK